MRAWKQHKVDANHGAVVDHLRSRGCSVISLAELSKGCPDVCVGYRGVNILLEIKDGAKPHSARKLTPDEVLWHAKWSGQVTVVYGPEDAYNAVQAAYARHGIRYP